MVQVQSCFSTFGALSSTVFWGMREVLEELLGMVGY